MTADHESHPAKGLAHWRDRLAGTPPALELATSRPRGADRVWTPATSTGDVCPKRTGRITALAAARDAKPDEAGIALVAAFLLRTTGQRDLCLGVDDGGVRRPLRLDLAGQPSFLDLLDRVDEELAAAREEGDVPLADILVDLGIDAPDLFQVAVGSTGAEGTDLAFDVDLARGDVSLVYNAALFDEQATARMQGHLSTLVDGIIATPDAPVGTLPFLTAEEREQILVTWNDKTVPFPLDATLHGLFEERAAAQPARSRRCTAARS